MGVYFKVTSLCRDENPRLVNAPYGSRNLYREVERIVGEKRDECSGVPICMEVDSWGELAWVGQRYECEDFIIECIDLQEFETSWRFPTL